MKDRQFPIQDGPSIPWTMIQPHENQAERNHGQTLERLAERGGLGCYEAICVLEDRAIDVRESMSKNDDVWRDQLQNNLEYWEY